MGDAQSAQREGKKDAEAEEERATVEDALTEQNIEDKPLKTNGQISEINGKADSSIAEVNGHCNDENSSEAILSPDEDVSETAKPFKDEEAPLEIVEINEKETPNEADANEDVPLEMIEVDAKQNDINEGFRRFFSNIGLKLTVKRGSSEILTDASDKFDKEESNRSDDIEHIAKETQSANAEQNTDVTTAPETYDNDSTTCPTLTDVTSEDVLENAEEKTTEAKEVEVESDNADTEGEGEHQDATPEEEPHSISPHEEEVVVSPIKKFFTTGIFSGLRKKKKPAEDETNEKELVDMGKMKVVEITEQTAQDQQQVNEEISLGVEAAAVETEHGENKLEEPEILSSQEKSKVQASPLKRLLSGSSLKKLSKKQRGRRSSDGKLSDSGEHVSDQLMSSTELPENQKEEGPAQPVAEAAGEEESAWASFKKLLTPKKRMKGSSLSNEEAQIPVSVEEPKPSEGEQISDQSTEEGKKRKDSSVSWEAVLCGSGKRRSRKTSDSEDETPQIDDKDNKQDGGSKHGAESLEGSHENENEILASSPKQAGSPSDSDGGSTWKSLKRLVTPKRKAKEEDESKDNVQSDTDGTQDESSFLVKKLLPGRKKRKSAEKQDQVSSDEADKDVPSGDEDSETPAVVPLSEFDTIETEVQIQTQADIESHIPKEADNELQQDLLDQMTEPVLLCDNLETEAMKVKDNEDALENKASTTPATHEEPDDRTELISKHQQLSDIPEEGMITETMVTPASIAEEAARDDTIAEDLIEITSEAITAPEPASDSNMADETEMISAVSRLSSESSKTSGNTTPVPAEYDVVETDALLHQVVETIGIQPNAVPVRSDNLNSERIAGCVSHQILETFEKEEPIILDIHRRLDANTINTGLNVVAELDANNELATSAQTESISEINDSPSTEVVSEVPTEEFDIAEIALDEAHKVNVTHPEESVKAAIVADETKDGTVEQEVPTLPQKEDQFIHNIIDQIQVEDQPLVKVEELATVQTAILDSEEGTVQLLEKEEISAAEILAKELKEGTAPPTEVDVEQEKEDELETDAAKTEHVEVSEVLEASEAVQAYKLESEEGSVQSLEKEVISVDVPEEETVTDEPKEETVPLTKVHIGPEKEDELETDADKTEHVKVSEVSEAIQASTLDSEEGSVQSLEKEVMSEDVPEAETVTDEPKEETVAPTEVHVEPQKEDQLETDATKTEKVKVSEIPEATEASEVAQASTYVQSLEKEVMSEDVPEAETVTDEPKEEKVPLTEVNVEPAMADELETGAAKTEHVQVTDTLEIVQAPALDSEKDSVQSPEVKPEDISPAKAVTDKSKEETVPLTEVHVEPEKEDELETCAAKTDQVEVSEVPEALEAVQATTLDSQEGSAKSPGEEVKSKDILPTETVTDAPKDETVPLTEVNVEPEEEDVQETDAAKTEHIQEPGALEVVQAPTLDSEEGAVQSPEEKVEDIPPPEAVTDEPKEETVPLTEDRDESEKEQPPMNAVKTEQGQVPEASGAVQTPTLDSEGSVQSPEEEVKSEDILPTEIVTDGPKEETLHPSEVSVEPEEEDVLETDTAKTEHVQVPGPLEAVQAPTLDSEESTVKSLEKEVMSEDVPEAESVTDEPTEEAVPLTEVSVEPEIDAKTEHVQDESKQETEVRVEPEEELPVEAAQTEDVQEPEILPSSIKDIVTESKTEEGSSMHPGIEGGSALELEKQILSEDVPKLDADNVITSGTDKIKSEVVAQPDQALVTMDQNTQSIPQDVQVEQEDHIPEVTYEIQTLTAVHVSSVNEEASNVQVLEKPLLSEETPVPCADNAAVTDEAKHEVHLSAVQVSIEEEKESEISGTEIKTAVVEHAAVPQIGTCNLKEVSAAIPDVLIEKTSDITEPLLETVANQIAFKEELKTATPFKRDDVTETAQESSVVMMMHVPSVEFEDNHKIQVQVVDVDMKSAKTIMDTVLEVGVTEAKEVIDVCHETVKKVDHLSATPEIEEELIEENTVTIHEVTQHVKENLPETVPESVVVNLEQQVIKQPDAVTEVSELVQSESNELGNEKTMEDSIGSFKERQDEVPVVISDVSGTEEHVSEDLMQMPDIPGDSSVSIHDHKEDLEETKAEQERSEAGVTAEEVKSSSKELDAKKNEQAQIASSPLVTPSNTELVAPQNTGIISSVGNVESPSSLSLEFKLNIQFGQVKAPASPPPIIERTEPVKQIDVSEVGVQAVEAVEPMKPIILRDENQKQTELTDVTVQTTEITEPAASLESTEKAVITTQPILLDVCINAVETVEPVEQIKSMDRVTFSVQATETIEPIRQTEKKEVFLSHPAISEASENPSKQTEEENDQDVWMDAEEGTDTQDDTEVSFFEVGEPLEAQTESTQEKKAGLEHEGEMAPNSKTEEGGSQKEMHKAEGTREIESEGEDFAVALEHPETTTGSITTMEWD